MSSNLKRWVEEADSRGLRSRAARFATLAFALRSTRLRRACLSVQGLVCQGRVGLLVVVSGCG
jgi:hypothetical protein